MRSMQHACEHKPRKMLDWYMFKSICSARRCTTSEARTVTNSALSVASVNEHRPTDRRTRDISTYKIIQTRMHARSMHTLNLHRCLNAQTRGYLHEYMHGCLPAYLATYLPANLYLLTCIHTQVNRAVYIFTKRAERERERERAQRERESE